MTSKISRVVAPYGLWKSPISANLLTQKNVSFGELAVLSSTKEYADIAYVENRPQEGGRAALLARRIALGSHKDPGNDENQGKEIDLSRGELNVRSGIHEYGGGALAPSAKDGALFTDYKSFGVFQASPDGSILDKITMDNAALRFGDFSDHPTLPLVAAIAEDHAVDEPSKVINTISVIDKQTKKVHVIASGYDFYTSPRFSPDGQYIAWVSWNHPSMPFWATEVWIAKFEPGNDAAAPSTRGATKVAGDNETEVAHYPLWIGQNTLLFTRDVSGYSNPFTVSVKTSESALSLEHHGPVLKSPVDADFTAPAWQVNNSTYAKLSDDWLICILKAQSFDSLALLQLSSGALRRLDTPFVAISQLRVLDSTTIIFSGVQETEPSSLVVMNLKDAQSNDTSDSKPSWQVIKRTSALVSDGIVPAGFLAKTEKVSFPTELPNGSQATSHALYFAPCNPDYVGPAGASPPCIFKIHGGPTSSSQPGANLGISYWTSRGYGVCLVEYGGSTSYGRKYMQRLNGEWGVVDVRDAAAAASFLSTGGSKDIHKKASRRISAIAQKELERLGEEHFPGGGVQFSLKRAGSALDLVKDATIALAFGFGTAFLRGHVDIQSIFNVPSMVALLASFVARVREERVTALPGVGLQVSTLRGPSWPSLWGKGRGWLERVKFIPRDSIRDIFTREAFQRWRVIDYLAVAVGSPRSSSDYAKESSHDVEKGRDISLTTIFPHLQPRLPVVEHVYRGIYASLFGMSPSSSSRQDGEARVDGERIAISGGSAGGFTVLASLCLYPTLFKAGTSLYGVSRIVGLVESSHKFESEYVNRLMGGPPEEIPQVYHDRSPLYMADRIRAPVLLMQGDIDKVVPPEQSEAIFHVLQKQQVKTKYLLFEGEGHGFRKAENIKKALEEEEAWYKEVFKL